MTIFTVQTKETKTIRLSQSGDYEVHILGEGANVKIVGGFVAAGDEFLNINLKVVHKAPHTRAQTVLKGVAKNSASIRFFGLIKIEKNCPDTQSFLEERVLLLSDNAQAEAIPELEILSDDVKCSHAASISQIPEVELFYLMSRGIPRNQAEEMIIAGFLETS